MQDHISCTVYHNISYNICNTLYRVISCTIGICGDFLGAQVCLTSCNADFSVINTTMDDSGNGVREYIYTPAPDNAPGPRIQGL